MPEIPAKDLYGISRFSGEFTDPALEAAFRRQAALGDARFAALTVAIAVAFFAAFVYTDYAALGPAARPLLGVRLLVLLGGGLVAWQLLRRPQLAMTGAAVTLLELIVFSAFFLVVALRPAELTMHGMSMVVMLTGIYLFVPNRPPQMLAAGAFGTAGFLASAYYAAPPGETDFVSLFLLLLLTNCFGFLGASRDARLRREQFALLHESERTRAELLSTAAERTRVEAELRRLATTDPLTGLYNRREYLKLSQQELSRARRNGQPTSVCLIDADHFKAINDSRGHSHGDEALRLLADTFRELLREGDIVGRFGGEEFVCTLHNTDLSAALQVAERLRRSVAGAAGADVPQLTVTIGVAQCRAGEPLEQALQRADAALYRGKHEGRNRVVAAGTCAAEFPLAER